MDGAARARARSDKRGNAMPPQSLRYPAGRQREKSLALFGANFARPSTESRRDFIPSRSHSPWRGRSFHRAQLCSPSPPPLLVENTP